MIYRYRISLRPLAEEEGGGWLAEVPELPGCMSDGETPQLAVENVMDRLFSARDNLVHGKRIL